MTKIFNGVRPADSVRSGVVEAQRPNTAVDALSGDEQRQASPDIEIVLDTDELGDAHWRAEPEESCRLADILLT